MSLEFGEHRELLCVGPSTEQSSLRRIFHDSAWTVKTALTTRSGFELLRNCGRSIPVVICDNDPPERDWKWLLARLDLVAPTPRLIVSARLGDELLWAEVLNLGGFDLVLADPFVPEEVLRVTDSAWRACVGSTAREKISCKSAASSQSRSERQAVKQIASIGG